MDGTFATSLLHQILNVYDIIESRIANIQLIRNYYPI